MKTNFIHTIALAIPFAFASCSGEPEEPAADNSGNDAPGEYPLTTCVVSGEELGSMGKPVEYDHEGTTVKFCCKECLPKFKESPAQYLAKLKQ